MDKDLPKGSGIAFGIVFKVVFGMALDNIALGAGIGIVLGAAFEAGRG